MHEKGEGGGEWGWGVGGGSFDVRVGWDLGKRKVSAHAGRSV
jgi:hypothetical protein